MRQLRIGLAQVNVAVGDVEGNTRRVLDEIERARALAVDLVAFPELCLTGYPPEDLLFRASFIEANLRALERVARASTGLTDRGGLRRPARRHHERGRGVSRRPGGRRVPQAVPAELRGLRREPVLPGGNRDADLRARRGRARAGGEHLRGHLVPHRADDRADAGRGRGRRVDQLVAVPRRARCAFREKMLATRAADHVGYLAFVNLVGRPGRAGLRRPVHGVRSGGRPAGPRARLRGGPGRRGPRPRRRVPRPAPRLPAAQGEAGGRRSGAPDTASGSPGAVSPAGPRAGDRVPRTRRGGVRRARDRDARLRPEERLPASGRRTLGRHRLGAHRGDRGGRAGTRGRRGGLHAVRVLVRRDAGGCAARGPEPRDRVPDAADHPGVPRLPAGPGRAVQGPEGGRGRGERPGPRARHAPDGAVEQVRLARADDRQQERDRASATARSTGTWPAGSR